jgi:hypothetical protein
MRAALPRDGEQAVCICAEAEAISAIETAHPKTLIPMSGGKALNQGLESILQSSARPFSTQSS